MTKFPPKQNISKWVVRDEAGDIIGIRHDAPDQIKREYDAVMRKEYTAEGFLIKY